MLKEDEMPLKVYVQPPCKPTERRLLGVAESNHEALLMLAKDGYTSDDLIGSSRCGDQLIYVVLQSGGVRSR